MKTLNQTALVAVTIAAGLMVGASATSATAAAGQCGRASWYALHSRTASGERMNPSALTAAHRTLPFGTKLRVTNQNNGRSVVVRINDRGPFIRGRVLDLSKGAAGQLGFIGSGHTSVCMARV
ncbi:septal ring lytic transglycosylase RlpA family protein [Mesorhizobium sp. B2-4-19]|uniref:septal ring lytic transglycosylase RlpA family protein n=1 Tax=Mesorhizobium sp. B2-4-19 TaxID=2589930 RepID=UPI001126989B|nr:septal ring lytic transglycosylase RlpA family protein [Mesorhizobium sp. B2-4-19]TPK63049.1 septal ring lytic transglycosylase RlpA family protein [Mesorhizobium sp. B2-4-19]